LYCAYSYLASGQDPVSNGAIKEPVNFDISSEKKSQDSYTKHIAMAIPELRLPPLGFIKKYKGMIFK